MKSEQEKDVIDSIRNYKPSNFDNVKRGPLFDEFMTLRNEIITKRVIEPDDFEKLKKFSTPHYSLFPNGETIDDLKAELLILKLKDRLQTQKYEK